MYRKGRTYLGRKDDRPEEGLKALIIMVGIFFVAIYFVIRWIFRVIREIILWCEEKKKNSNSAATNKSVIENCRNSHAHDIYEQLTSTLKEVVKKKEINDVQ